MYIRSQQQQKGPWRHEKNARRWANNVKGWQVHRGQNLSRHFNTPQYHAVLTCNYQRRYVVLFVRYTMQRKICRGCREFFGRSECLWVMCMSQSQKMETPEKLVVGLDKDNDTIEVKSLVGRFSITGPHWIRIIWSYGLTKEKQIIVWIGKESNRSIKRAFARCMNSKFQDKPYKIL